MPVLLCPSPSHVIDKRTLFHLMLDVAMSHHIAPIDQAAFDAIFSIRKTCMVRGTHDAVLNGALVMKIA